MTDDIAERLEKLDAAVRSLADRINQLNAGTDTERAQRDDAARKLRAYGIALTEEKP